MAAFDQSAKDFTALGNRVMDAAVGNPAFGAIFRQPLPATADTLTLLHWLFAAKGDIPIPTVDLAYQLRATGGQLVVPAAAGGGFVRQVWQVYPADRALLFPSPTAPVVGGGGVPISAIDWENVNGRTIIAKPELADGNWKLVYSYGGTGEVVQRGDGYEALPVWKRIASAYEACAPDSGRWFAMAAARAIEQDTRTGKADVWTKWRDAVRRSVARSQAISDQRDVLLPLKGLSVFYPDGMFCWSDHPSAKAPPAPLDQGWLGYNFWSRDATTGDVIAVVPNSSNTAYTVQLGRDVFDGWRQANTYQEADQYLYVEMGAKLEATGGKPTGTAKVFVSSERDYKASARWMATVDLSGGTLITTVDGLEIRGYRIPRASLLRVDNATALPDGQQIMDMGLELKLQGRYVVRARKLRLLSGPTAAWVDANLEQAKKGSRIPYAPGAAPFRINADTASGNLVGANGCPLHGHQLPDAWLAVPDAGELFPGLTAAQLPVPNGTGGIAYPITANNVNGTAKPLNLLLAEQQVMFLRDAQARYTADRGVNGPFAHTFVLNTSARLSIGSPVPHTWVYAGDTPDTAAGVYQVRPVESMCRLIAMTKGNNAAQDVRALARTVAKAWLNWLAVAWANIDGMPWRGPPTDFPGDKAASASYEDPQIAAIALRALLWLRIDGDTTPVLDGLATRCWNYLEYLWNTTGRMSYTWSAIPSQLNWFGEWHGEIIETLSVIVRDAKAVLPSTMSRDVALDRLTTTYNWLSKWGIREGK